MTNQVDEVQTDEQAMQSVMAGYNKTARDEPPVVEETPTEKVQEVVAEVPAGPTPQELADELKALKAKVAASQQEPESIRKLYGEIGEINRTLKQLTPAPAPVKDEWTAALEDVDKVAEEYPEIAGPIVKALHASLARKNPTQSAEEIDKLVAAKVSEIEAKHAEEKIRTAQEELMEEHPDFYTVRETPEYKTWLASKPPEFQHRFQTTWSPAVVSKGLTDFKNSLKARERKQTRLEGAVTPQGVPAQKSSVLPDEAGLWAGYNKGPKRPVK